LLPTPDPALRFQYYHQDHLGSPCVISDAQGQVAEELALFPFGGQRHRLQSRSTPDPYQFNQKERDGESLLHYFESRYQAGQLARFLSVDVKYAHPDTLSASDATSFLSNPQQGNLYAYVLNNPLKLVDPTGLDGKPPKSKVLVVYTRDMLKDATTRMKIADKAAYEKALESTYQPEAGANADIRVKHIGSWKELGSLLKGNTFDTVIINTHAYGNHQSLFMGENENLDEVDVKGLEQLFGGAKKPPGKIFFYGCNTATSGLAGQLSKNMPETAVTGATTVIKQHADFKNRRNRAEATVRENRDYNATFVKGEKVFDARTVNTTQLQNAPIVP
jgi:RHS repeat-associated protein